MIFLEYNASRTEQCKYMFRWWLQILNRNSTSENCELLRKKSKFVEI